MPMSFSRPGWPCVSPASLAAAASAFIFSLSSSTVMPCDSAYAVAILVRESRREPPGRRVITNTLSAMSSLIGLGTTTLGN